MFIAQWFSPRLCHAKNTMKIQRVNGFSPNKVVCISFKNGLRSTKARLLGVNIDESLSWESGKTDEIALFSC